MTFGASWQTENTLQNIALAYLAREAFDVLQASTQSALEGAIKGTRQAYVANLRLVFARHGGRNQ